MEQVVANIYAACLSAESEPHAELVDLTINAIQDGLVGPKKDETLSAIFTAVEELSTERKQKGALFRIKLIAIASAAKSLPQGNRDALLKSLKAMGEVARQYAMAATSDTVHTIVDAIKKMDTTAIGQPAPPSVPATEQVAQQERGQVRLQDYLKQHATHAASDKIVFAPDIPLKKISGALASIGGMVRPEEIVVLIDDTVFGGSKEGVFVTNDRIFVKEKFTGLATYRLDSIQHIGAEGLKIFVNHREIVGLTMPDKPDLEALFSAINGYLASTRMKPKLTVAPGQTSAPDLDEEEEDEDVEVPELGALHGYFYLRAAQLYPHRDAENYHERVLMVDLVNASMGLYGFLLRNGFSLSEESKWVATTDVVHFESLLYSTVLCLHLLSKKLGLSNDVMDSFTKLFFDTLVYPYVQNFNSFTELNEQVRLRVALYKTMMDENPSELPGVLHISISVPGAVLEMLPDEQQYMRDCLAGLNNECFDMDVTMAYMRETSEKVEAALVRFTNNVRSAW